MKFARFLVLLLAGLLVAGSVRAAYTPPGGINGEIQYNNNGKFGGLSVIPYSSGGTGLSILGTPGQSLVVNQAGTALTYANFGSQGVRPVTTGCTDTSLIADGLIQWDSSSNCVKTETVIAGNTNGQTLNIADGQGNAAQFPITLSAGTGVTIGGQAQLALSDDFFNVSLTWDNLSNWIITNYYSGSKTGISPSYLLTQTGTILAIGNGNYLRLF